MKAAKAKEKELEEWLRGLEGMDRLVDDYVGDKIPLWSAWAWQSTQATKLHRRRKKLKSLKWLESDYD